MELQVPYRICPAISTTNRVWEDQNEHRSNTADIVRAEESGDFRSGSMPRPHSHVGEHPPELERVPIYGIPEREKLPDDI